MPKHLYELEFPLISYPPPERISPILLATTRDDTRMAQLLVEAGANIDLELSRGFSPIIIAISLAHKEMVQYLIEQKANLQVTSKYGDWPSH